MTRRAPRRRDSAVASAQQLEKLVQTVQRQFMTTTNDDATHHRTPPNNAAATALGRQVGTTLVTFLSACLDEEKLVQIRDELLLNKVILCSDDDDACCCCLHPSIPHAMLEAVSEAYYQQSSSSNKEKMDGFEVLDWLPVWILQIEKSMVEQQKQAASFASTSHLLEAFTAALRAYAVALQVDALIQEEDDNDDENNRKQQDEEEKNDDDDDDQDVVVTTGLLELHGRLELTSSRMALVRHVIPLLISSTPFFSSNSSSSSSSSSIAKNAALFRRIVPILSPLLTSSVLHLGRDSSEKWAALQAVWSATHKVIQQKQQQQQPRQQQQTTTYYSLDLLQWMTTLLDWYLWGLVNTAAAQQADLELQSLELAQMWWTELGGMTYALFRNIRKDSSSSDKKQILHVSFQLFVRRLLRETFPRLVQSIQKCPLLVLGVQPLLQGCSNLQSLLVDLCAYYSSSSSRVILLDDAVLQFRWATLMLTSPRGEDRRALLEALLPLLCQQSGSIKNSQRLIHAVALMQLHDESCREVAAKAIWLLQQQQEAKEPPAATSTSTALVSSVAAKDFHIIQQVVTQEHDYPSSSSSSSWSPLIRMALTYSLPIPTTLADGTVVVDDSSSCYYFSPAQQSAALLFGVALLEEQEHDNSSQDRKEEGEMNDGYSFLQRLLTRYPHLGISLLPILMDRLNTASRQGNGRGVVRELEFLCEHLVADPHCAQEVWNLVGNQLVAKSDVPLQVRVLLIRLFPQLLRANKRLYRRVIETLSNIMSSASSVQIDADREQQQVEMRLAVAATISDLAKDDAIRDVSDVIAWIQRLLTQDATNASSASITGTTTTASLSTKTPDSNEHALMFVSNPMQMLQVHYAILSLHYLVVAQELDFEVVLKVLNKRLCPVTNVGKILQLPPIVLESLVLLLGDGECNDDDDSDDEEKQTGVSPQVSRAVETLLQLASAMVDRIIALCNENGDNRSNFRVLSNIFKSLGGYSMEALGLDEDVIKDGAGKPIDAEHGDHSKSDNRYGMLHQLIVDAIEELPQAAFENDDTNDGNQEDSLVLLLRNLLKFEQETLGSSLWEKRGKRQLKTGGEANNAISRGRLSALPTPSSVRDRCKKGNQNSPSIACAILFASEAEGFELLTQFRDEGDACIESTDPTFLVFAVQTYLTTAARVVGTVTEQEIEKVLADVGAWCKVYTTRDSMYLALSAISLYIPHTLRESESSDQTYAQGIRDVITSAYKNQRFEKSDVSKICLGLVGAASLRQGLSDAVEDIFSLLEQSVRGYGGQQSFGANYGLGLLGQILPQCVGSSSSSSPSTSTTQPLSRNDGDERVFSLISRISGFLVEELLSCFEPHHGPSFQNLVVCFKSGIVTSDLISSVRQKQSGSIPLLMTKQVAAKYLCMSCALCLPSLCAVNGQLLLATFRVLETLSWGCGKGLALPTIIRACVAGGLLLPEEMEQVHSEYASQFQTHLEEAREDEGKMLNDLLVAVIGTSDGPSPQLVRSLLAGDVRLKEALLASATSICTFPCFGSDLFPLPARLKPTSQADIKCIVDLVSNAVDLADESKYSQMGFVLLGLLSSLRNPTSSAIAADHCLPKTNKQKSAEPLGVHSAPVQALDFSKLPSPRSQTILSVVMDGIERAVKHGARTTGSLKSPFFVTMLESLEVVALPDQFSAGLLEPMFHQLPQELKPALVNLLVSQGRGRRPAAMGGTGFVQLSLQISLASHSHWKSTLGGEKAVASFVQNLFSLLPKFPVNTLQEVIANVWHHCWTGGKSIMITFFEASRRLLEGDRLSEKGKEILGTILLSSIMSDLQTVPFDTVMDGKGGVLLEAFVGCLQHLSLSLLETEGFFEYDESEPAMDEEVLRVASSTELIRLGFFQAIKREVHERSRISAWISRRLVAPLDDETIGVLRRLIFCLVEAVNTARSNVSKPDQLAELLEILLLSRGSRIGLEWLAIVMSIWCGAQGSDADLSLGCLFTSDLRSMQGLSDLTKIMVHDLPFNIGNFCRKEKVSAIVFNLLHRLFLRWSEDGECTVDRETLECLQHSLISCRPGLAKEDVFVSVACDALVKVSVPAAHKSEMLL